MDGIHDVGISVVTGGNIGHCGSTFSVCGQRCVTDVPDAEDETHVLGLLAPEFELIPMFPPSLACTTGFGMAA